MRFRTKEFRSFVAAIEKATQKQSDFDFVKKRGWLNITHKESKKTFRYHRKKETILDENVKWKDSYEFWIKVGEEKKEIKENEAAVINAFENWLKKDLS